MYGAVGEGGATRKEGLPGGQFREHKQSCLERQGNNNTTEGRHNLVIFQRKIG